MSAIRLFEQMLESVVGAASHHSRIDRYYEIAGQHIRLQFLGARLAARMEPALSHLSVAQTERPDLTAWLWDRSAIGTDLPYSPWQLDAFTARGEVRNVASDRIRLAYNADARVLNLLDRERKLALYSVADASTLPAHEWGAPLLRILHWHFADIGWQCAHAGAIGRNGEAVILAGKGGSGKSTTALVCSAAGWSYTADDYCLIHPGTPPAVHSLYAVAKLSDVGHKIAVDSVPALDRLKQRDEKNVYPLAQLFADRICKRAIVRAVVAPIVTGMTESSLVPIDAATALLALAPSTIVQLPGAGQEALSRLTRMMRQIPSYRLELGTDLGKIPHVLSRALDR